MVSIWDWLNYVIMPLVGYITVFTVPWLIPLLWKKLLPSAARTMFWAARRKQPPALICHDSGRSQFTLVKERRGSGVVFTDTGKYKILPRYRLKTSTVQKKKEDGKTTKPVPELSGDKKEILKQVQGRLSELKDRYILDYTDWIVKRSMLIGLDLPLFVGYSGKLCLLNPEALALYEAGELYIKTEDETMFNPHELDGKEMEDAFQPLMLIDPRKIKEIINDGFDQAQIAAIVVDSELIGLQGRGMGRYLPYFMIIGVVIVALLAIFLLPSILPMG